MEIKKRWKDEEGLSVERVERVFSIERTFYVNYAHRLHNMAYDHPCSNLHGHEAKITIEVKSNCINNITGFVVDFEQLKQFENLAKDELDHTTICAYSDIYLMQRYDCFSLPEQYPQTSSECICHYLFQKYKNSLTNKAENIKTHINTEIINAKPVLASISFWETRKNKATYSERIAI